MVFGLQRICRRGAFDVSDALSRYRQADTQTNALDRYKRSDAVDLGALAKYLGLSGYWDRQGRMASQGLQMADQGAQAVRGGDLSGLAGMVLGPVGYLSSPINALFPERSEVEAATDAPEWSKPLIAGGLETMAIMAPGPKGPKGLGRGMASLADDATDAERLALEARLDAEDQAALDALDKADGGGPDVKPETVKGWLKSKSMDMGSILRNELDQAVAAGDTAKAEKLRREIVGMGYSLE